MRELLKVLIACLVLTVQSAPQAREPENQPGSGKDQVIFAFGGEINKGFIRYVAALTRLPRPRICYVPTGSADNVYNINYWYEICCDLPIEPHVLKVWVSSFDDPRSFEDILLGMDAIIVGGGNTLNMMAIWRAQGIDAALQKALQRGIILAGGSAGSLCWFENGISDSRPKELSVVDGLGLLKYSHCPHYSGGESRKKIFQDKILDGALHPGYGCDDFAGILFKNGRFVKAVTLNEKHHAYLVSVVNGKIAEDRLESEILN
jgi:dipeptidase E